MRTMLPLVALAALAGCASGNGDLWLFHVPVMSNYDCATDITENFTDADPPAEDEPTADWIFTEESTLSEGLVFGQIVDGKKKTAYLTMGDLVYPGVKDSDGYTFTWESSEVSESGTEYVPNPYQYGEEIKNTKVVTIKLAPNKDTRGLKGTYQVEDKVDESYTESDEWDPEVPVATGQINNVSVIYLVGTGTTNEGDRPNCDDELCMLDVVATCSGSVDLTAEWIGYADEGVYAAVEDAEQPAGI